MHGSSSCHRCVNPPLLQRPGTAARLVPAPSTCPMCPCENPLYPSASPSAHWVAPRNHKHSQLTRPPRNTTRSTHSGNFLTGSPVDVKLAGRCLVRPGDVQRSQHRLGQRTFRPDASKDPSNVRDSFLHIPKNTGISLSARSHGSTLVTAYDSVCSLIHGCIRCHSHQSLSILNPPVSSLSAYRTCKILFICN